MAKIVVPVADLRREPQELSPKTFDNNPLRESQLLFNEEIELIETHEKWVKIAAFQQPRFTPERGWHLYEGWVRRSEVGEGRIEPKYVVSSPCHSPGAYSYGTYSEQPLPGSRPLPSRMDRAQLVQEARLFLDAPYLWGGCASVLPNAISSVDCSSLVYLLYRAQGVTLPRDAKDQFLAGIKVAKLQPGDALYLAKEEAIHHVILKLEEDLFLEAFKTGTEVRLLREGVDLWQDEKRWVFRDKPDSFKGFAISHEKIAYPA